MKKQYIFFNRREKLKTLLKIDFSAICQFQHRNYTLNTLQTVVKCWRMLNFPVCHTYLNWFFVLLQKRLMKLKRGGGLNIQSNSNIWKILPRPGIRRKARTFILVRPALIKIYPSATVFHFRFWSILWILINPYNISWRKIAFNPHCIQGKDRRERSKEATWNQ